MDSTPRSRKICKEILKQIHDDLPIYGYAQKTLIRLERKGLARSIHQIRNTKRGKSFDLHIVQAMVEIVQEINPLYQEQYDIINELMQNQDHDADSFSHGDHLPISK